MRAKGFIAIEVGAAEIRLSEINRGSVIRAASHPIDSEAAGPRDAIIAAALKMALDELCPSTRRAVLVLDGRSVFVKTFRLPALGADKWPRALAHEAGINLPLPLAEVIWNAHIIDPSVSEPYALLVAAKKELVQGLVHAAAANGLSTECITAAPVALANAALAHAGNLAAGMAVVAEHVDTVDLVYVDPSRVLIRSLSAPLSEERLADELEASFSIPVGAEKRVQRLPTEIPGWSVTAGLALEGPLKIDLSPPAVGRERLARRHRPLWAACAVIGMVLLAAGIGATRASACQIRIRAERMARRAGELSGFERGMIPVERDIAGLERSAENLVMAMDQRLFWRDTLVEVARLMPEGMYLLGSETIVENDTVVGVRLEVLSYLDKEEAGLDVVRVFRNALRLSERFQSTSRVHSRPSRGAFVRRFTLDALFEEVPQ